MNFMSDARGVPTTSPPPHNSVSNSVRKAAGNSAGNAVSDLPREHTWPFAPWVGDVILGAVVISTALVPFGSEARAPGAPLTVGLMTVAALALPLRRRRPRAIFCLTLLIFASSVALGVTSPPFILPVGISLFGLSVRSSSRITLVFTVIGTVVSVVTTWFFLPANIFDPRVIQLLALLGFAAAAGQGTQARRAYIDAITERALRAEQTRESEARRQVAEERLRIARDLHDAVAHQIAVINLHAGVASQALPERPDDAQKSLATIREAARSVLSEIGDLLRVLRAAPGSQLESASMSHSPRDGSALTRLQSLVALFSASGLTVNLRVTGTERALIPARNDVLYRVAYESLTNAQKHGSLGTAELTVAFEPTAVGLTITNPASRSRVAAGKAHAPISGHGLIGIRERLAEVGGTVTSDFIDDSRFTLVATVPLGVEQA
ncbi:histidine kinase [soil metagenome]